MHKAVWLHPSFLVLIFATGPLRHGRIFAQVSMCWQGLNIFWAFDSHYRLCTTTESRQVWLVNHDPDGYLILELLEISTFEGHRVATQVRGLALVRSSQALRSGLPFLRALTALLQAHAHANNPTTAPRLYCVLSQQGGSQFRTNLLLL